MLAKSCKTKILFVEHNSDGTTGGSHQSLLQLVKHIDATKYEVTVVFYENHRLLAEFKKYARILVLKKPVALNIESVIRTPALMGMYKRVPAIASMLILYQKCHNLNKLYLLTAIR